MSEEESETAPVRFGELLETFELACLGGSSSEARVSIGRETGKVHMVLSEFDEDDPEQSEDCIAVPDSRSLDLGTELVLAFAEQEMPDAYDAVRDIFRRKGAYGRFKALLHTGGKLDQWYAFEAKATEEALGKWCWENGIALMDN